MNSSPNMEIKVNNNKEILRGHYIEQLRRLASWIGLVGIFSTMLIAGPASALGNQLGARTALAAKLTPGNTGTYTLTFNPGTSGVVGSMKFELCDSPLETVACANSTTSGINSYGDSFATSVITVAGTGWTGGTWTTGAVTGPAGAGGTGVSAKVANGGVTNTPTTAQPATVTITNVVNPTGNNQKFYLRITTFQTITYTSETDFGAVALQTAQDLNVTANVQESLTFCTGLTTAAACASVGSPTVPLGTGTNCPILTTANVCTGTSQMTASTNASGGYAVTYLGTTFTNTAASDTITETGGSGATSVPGSKQFGLAITAQSGSGSVVAAYNFGSNGSKYTYVSGSPQAIVSGTAANGENTYTVTYAGNVSSITKAGQYTATFSYVCTGSF